MSPSSPPTPHLFTSEDKISEFMLKYATTSCSPVNKENDEIRPSTLSDSFTQQIYIKDNLTNNLQPDQLATTEILPMDIRDIINDNDYQTCVDGAGRIEYMDKSSFCPNFYYVFYAELEIHLNRYFTQTSREQWSLLFVDYNFMPPVRINTNRVTSFRTFYYQPHVLTILHNAKVKYSCLDCGHEWATARGRAIFQAEKPEINKHNILFAHLFTQKCKLCHRETEPSWYLDEATRVMKMVCRTLIEQFYLLHHPPSSRFSSSSSEENFDQRESTMRDHHHRDLCSACQEGSCYV